MWGLLEACVSGYKLHSNSKAASFPGTDWSGVATVGGRRPAVRWYDARCILLKHSEQILGAGREGFR